MNVSRLSTGVLLDLNILYSLGFLLRQWHSHNREGSQKSGENNGDTHSKEFSEDVSDRHVSLKRKN